eukprot:5107374-Pyramimonas_sp.AAC.2
MKLVEPMISAAQHGRSPTTTTTAHSLARRWTVAAPACRPGSRPASPLGALPLPPPCSARCSCWAPQPS